MRSELQKEEERGGGRGGRGEERGEERGGVEEKEKGMKEGGRRRIDRAH